MAGRHSRDGAVALYERSVVDCTDLTPRELRARVETLQDEHVVRVEQACEELRASLDRLVAGVLALRERATARARAALPVVAGVAVAGVTTVLAVRITAGRRV